MCICLILPLDICMPDDNTLCVSLYVALDVNYMLNKNSLAIKKVQGQSEATMVISDQKL